MSTQTLTQALTPDNYARGCLTGNRLMIGVTRLDTGKYAAFSVVIETGVPHDYTEHDTLESALLNARTITEPNSCYEAFGCDKGSSCKGAQRGACTSCGNNTTQTPQT